MNPPEYDVSGTGCIEECRGGRVEAGKPASRYHSWSRWKTMVVEQQWRMQRCRHTADGFGYISKVSAWAREEEGDTEKIVKFNLG